MGWLMPRTREELATCCEGGMEDVLNTLFSSQGYSQIVPIDVTADDETVNITADLPGLEKDDIKIEYLDGVVTISGEKKSAQNDKEGGYRYREISRGTFRRQITVGDINFDSAQANYKQGELTLNLPKSESQKSKQLRVS